jgi:hypothetical protein
MTIPIQFAGKGTFRVNRMTLFDVRIGGVLIGDLDVRDEEAYVLYKLLARDDTKTFKQMVKMFIQRNKTQASINLEHKFLQ